MFEMKGDLCSYVIKVLREAINVKDIPDQYVSKRWTKQARVECVQDMHGHEIQANPKLQQTYQYRSLCSIFTRISSKASESEKACNLAHEHASNLARLVEDILRLEIAAIAANIVVELPSLQPPSSTSPLSNITPSSSQRVRWLRRRVATSTATSTSPRLRLRLRLRRNVNSTRASSLAVFSFRRSHTSPIWVPFQVWVILEFLEQESICISLEMHSLRFLTFTTVKPTSYQLEEY
ncbi:hypothetical protein LWI29_031140 [Acer saccharum]|uniref:Protein FAR1-RELATED SEQUENCE n=1 Tax=Acer saccharum TaxID=4024 RepID=A0AA39RP90_ACESA|nr:hypothetical protein LWI29_031140 [Acer saccharum]